MLLIPSSVCFISDIVFFISIWFLFKVSVSFFYVDFCPTKFVPVHSHCYVPTTGFAASAAPATSLYPSTPSTWANEHPPQSDSVPLTVPVVPWAREATVPSEASTTAPRTRLPVAMGCTA